MDQDGGALRIYPRSQHFRTPDEAVTCSSRETGGAGHVDISPINGRLLIFDSHLVHAVQKVTSPNKVRRALTLWINRPNNSGVGGETFF